MSKLTSLIRRAPKRFSAAVGMIAAAIIVPAVVFAWGPDRPTFTVEQPATYNTFNSITNNPNVGDERNFVRIKDAADTGPGNWKDEINVESNKEYLVQIYVHNNAADNLKLVAENTRVMATVPNTTGKSIQIDGFVTADNANPNKIWDQAIFKSSQDFNLTYVPGSAVLYNNAFGQTGAKLSDNIVTSTGALVGFDKLDGKVPGCFKYAGYVSFKVKAQVGGILNFTTEKLVSKKGENKWVDDYKAMPGETVDYLLKYKNVGTAQQDNVIIRDDLPANMTYVNGSTILGNANAPEGIKVSDNVTKDGINTGSYLPGGNAWIIFSAKVADKEALPCGTTKLVNKVHTTTGGYYKEDTANVTVDKECKPEAKYTCDALKVEKVDRTNFKFTTTYTVQNATFKGVTYVIRNASGAVVDTKTEAGNTATYTQTTPGSFTVQASIIVTVDGQDKTVSGNGCKGSFKVEELPKDIKVCELATKKIITIKESDFDSSKHSKNLDDCKEVEVKKIKVCELETKKIITIKKSDFDSSKHSKNLDDCKEVEVKKIKVCELDTKKIITIKETDFDATKHSKNLDDCKEVEVKEIEVCELKTKEIITIKETDFDGSLHSKDLDNCKEEEVKTIKVCEIDTKKIVTINEKDFDDSKHTKDLTVCETTPPELPQTGAAENIVAIVGLGAIAASIAYYVASRRALNQ